MSSVSGPEIGRGGRISLEKLDSILTLRNPLDDPGDERFISRENSDSMLLTLGSTYSRITSRSKYLPS